MRILVVQGARDHERWRHRHTGVWPRLRKLWERERKSERGRIPVRTVTELIAWYLTQRRVPFNHQVSSNCFPRICTIDKSQWDVDNSEVTCVDKRHHCESNANKFSRWFVWFPRDNSKYVRPITKLLAEAVDCICTEHEEVTKTCTYRRVLHARTCAFASTLVSRRASLHTFSCPTISRSL